jgi:hypothetical protein
METLHITVNIDWKLLTLVLFFAIIGGSSIAVSSTIPTASGNPSSESSLKSYTPQASSLSLGEPDYDSGWVEIAVGNNKKLTHNLSTANAS